MYAICEVRDCALAAQTASYHHHNATTLWCELGFLFHMMRAVQAHCERYHTPITHPMPPYPFLISCNTST